MDVQEAPLVLNYRAGYKVGQGLVFDSFLKFIRTTVYLIRRAVSSIYSPKQPETKLNTHVQYITDTT